MKELADILTAFDALCAEGKPSALATVIAVEGSAYRRPGARMLVAEDGRTWGGVSGGCLEQDVARRARGVIETGKPVRCRYDESGDADDDPESAGVSTGCGGAVDVFVQRLCGEHRGPIDGFARVVRGRRPVVLCTQLGGVPSSVGRCSVLGDLEEKGWDAWNELSRPRLLHAAAGEVFVERLMPPQALIVFGGGADVVPLVAIAKVLGWHVTVVAARPSGRLLERFATADELRAASAYDVMGGIAIPPDAAVVVMTHNLQRDRAILATLRGPFRYVGLLGPRHRTRRLMGSLPGGAVRGVDASKLFSPVGLELGGRTPEEVALAIVAEVQAVTHGNGGRPLRERRKPAESRPATNAGAKTDPERFAATAGNPKPGRRACPA